MTELEQLQADLLVANTTVQAAYDKYQKAWQAKGWNHPDVENAHDKYYDAERQQTAIERKIKQILKGEAAKHPVRFITWKKYGFRHIALSEQKDSYINYKRTKITYTDGISLCGNGYQADHTPNEYDDWYTPHDERGTDRPLCGTCKKTWKRMTGEDVS